MQASYENQALLATYWPFVWAVVLVSLVAWVRFEQTDESFSVNITTPIVAQAKQTDRQTDSRAEGHKCFELMLKGKPLLKKQTILYTCMVRFESKWHCLSEFAPPPAALERNPTWSWDQTDSVCSFSLEHWVAKSILLIIIRYLHQRFIRSTIFSNKKSQNY